MTLVEIINDLNRIALNQPAINEVLNSGDIYDLNSHRDAHFGVFCATQGQHIYDIEEQQMTYVFNLFYVDRLLSDNSNKNDIQSTGISTLKNIINTIREENYEMEVPEVYFDTFTERFSELCAGAYASVKFVVDADNNCADIF